MSAPVSSTIPRTCGRAAGAASDRAQSGFALVSAMAIVVLLAGVTLVVLMNMTLTSSRISEQQRLSTRETRAADNALESAINMIRMDPDAALGSFEECLGGTGIELPTNDRDVTVTATCEESERAMPVRDTPLGSAPAVQLVGANGYGQGTGGAVPWRVDCLRPTPLTTGCFPWAIGMSPTNYDTQGAAAINSYVPSLVHSGGLRAAGSTQTHTLGFAGDVLARRGSAAIVDPTTGEEAINVAGRFEQGDRGLLGDAALPCGISAPGHVWNLRSAQVVDADDAQGLPDCEAGAEDALALDDRAEIEPRPGLGEQFGAFASVPSCSGTVIEFQPGAYGKQQTSQINDLLDGSCPNRVFWFRPAGPSTAGNYWFDVDDTTNPDRNLWNSLIIADPTARVIFGTPKGGLSAAHAASATFPDACDPEAAGVEVILSPRTSLRHEAGKVSICDRDGTLSTDNVPAAIWQAVIMNAEVDDDNGFNLYKEDTSFGTTVTFYKAGAPSPTCGVYFPYKQKRMGAAHPLTLAFDLRSAKGQAIDGVPHCKDVDLTRADLHGSGVDVQVRQRRNIPVDIGIGTYRADLHVDSVELRAGWDLQPTTAVGGSGWESAANLLPTSPFTSSSDHRHGGFTLSGCPVFQSCPTATREVTLGGFDNEVHPHAPMSGNLRAAGSIVTGETTDSHFFTNNSFYDRGGAPDISDHSNFTAHISGLRDAPGATCSVNWSKVPFWGQSIYLDLLAPRSGNTCAGVLTSAEQLIGAQVRLEVYVERNSWGAWVDYGVRIDGVQFSTVTDGEYTRPRAPNVLSIGGGPGGDSSFTIHGQMSTPRNDLDIRWLGEAQRDAQGDPVPIGGGNMTLNGLGSYVAPEGEAGIICCSPSEPAERIVELTAVVDRGGGNTVAGGRARIVVSDIAGPGSGLVIEDWSIR